MATDYAAVMAVHDHDADWRIAGIGDAGYAELARTYVGPGSVPSQATLDALWPAVEADIALIEDSPTQDEMNSVAVGAVTGAAADAIRDRLANAQVARARIP